MGDTNVLSVNELTVAFPQLFEVMTLHYPLPTVIISFSDKS